MIDHENWNCISEGISLRGSNNIQSTQALFMEFNPDGPYTLKNQDVSKNDKTYVSAYKVFMSSIDESEAALKLVGSYQHWRKLCALKWFQEGVTEFGFEGVDQWRKDMEQRDRTEAKRQLLIAAQNGNVPAQRFIYELSGKPKKTKAKTQDESNGIDATQILKELRGARE